MRVLEDPMALGQYVSGSQGDRTDAVGREDGRCSWPGQQVEADCTPSWKTSSRRRKLGESHIHH